MLRRDAPLTRRAARRLPAVAALAGVLLLGATYAGLSVYKAFDYTTTPPQLAPRQTPADLGLAFEDVSFPAAEDALPISGWWIPGTGHRRALILAHGRYQNRGDYVWMAKPLHDAGFAVLLIDLRGHGASTRASCSYGVREQRDIAGAAAFLKDRGISSGSIGAIGWSLGGASALMAMDASSDIAAVVSDSAYADAEPLLADNVLRPGLALAMRVARGVDLDAIRPARSIARLDGRHAFLIHGALDVDVPVAHVERLHDAGGASVVETWIAPDAGHIGAAFTHPDEYVARVVAFFDSELR